jgi:type VI secretion system protein ImpK
VTDPFSNLVLPIFRRLIDLVGTLAAGGNSPSLDDVKRRVRGWIEDAELVASVDATLSVEFEMAKYGLVGWIDELLTDSAWGEEVGWGSEQHVLEWDLYRDHNRATKFYEHAEIAFAALTQARASADPLETYLMCVTLGFRGELKFDDARFNAWVDRVYAKVSESNSMADRPFAEKPGDAAGTPLLPRSGPGLLLKASILTAITTVATLAAYIASVHLEFPGAQ